MSEFLKTPFDGSLILRKKKSIKKDLENNSFTAEIRIAILGGSTANEIRDILELFLLDKGIKPIFYESEYNRWYEDSVFENEALDSFKPQMVYVHTSFADFYNESASNSFALPEEFLNHFYAKFETAWKRLSQKFACDIIQNNFELPFYRIFGNLDFARKGGFVNSVNFLNEKIAQFARENKKFYVQDINFLSSQIGLEKWYDRNFYHLYKVAVSYDAIPHLAHNLSCMIGSLLGKTKKCLVLDLDETLWGGIIGDDGADGIQIGHETPAGESFLEFQQYVLNLKNKGVLLAVCSKNDEETAKKGFRHPDSVLRESDFAAFVADYEPKSVNLKRIARELNIGLDSVVFIDDNPVERNLIRESLPEVAVPEVSGGNPDSYIKAVEDGKFFESVYVSAEDLNKSRMYSENRQRLNLECEYEKYDDFLKSLQMEGEIQPFKKIYVDRIAQLSNKSNQFNLTTKRYTNSQIEEISADENYLTLYGRLKDKFGDNGLVSVVIARRNGGELVIDLWLMSCRVLRRNFEYAMFSEFLNRAEKSGIKRIRGFYFKTAKNSMVENFYRELGFDCVKADEKSSEWIFEIGKNVFEKENYILIDKKSRGEEK